MTDASVTPGAEDLQFDEVTPASLPADTPLAVTCANCASSIDTEYYDINRPQRVCIVPDGHRVGGGDTARNRRRL
jgi:hypothetical protein